MKKIIKIFLIFVVLYISPQILAYDLKSDEKIGVSGDTIGIKLNTGVMVMDTFGVGSADTIIMPWANCNMQSGDIILSFNDKTITSSNDLLKEISIVKDNLVNIQLSRNSEVINTSIKPAKYNNGYTLGIYIKDYILGIGTLTYFVPGANIYGALGHSITNDSYYGGEIFEASVDEIIKPSKNIAGEKRATIDEDSIGDIKKNTITGIHGSAYDSINTNNMLMLSVGKKEDVKKGKAQILTCIKGSSVEFFDIEITSVTKQDTKDIKGIKFKVTDNELLNETGGIVQGMSGSPIIQDNKIIGAVTHVMLNNAKNGYGIFIEFMLEEMDIHLVE